MNDVDTESLRFSGIFNLRSLTGVAKVNILFQNREFVNSPSWKNSSQKSSILGQENLVSTCYRVPHHPLSRRVCKERKTVPVWEGCPQITCLKLRRRYRHMIQRIWDTQEGRDQDLTDQGQPAAKTRKQ